MKKEEKGEKDRIKVKQGIRKKKKKKKIKETNKQKKQDEQQPYYS